MTHQLEFLREAVRTGFATERPVRTVVIVVVLPFTQLLIEQVNVVGDAVSIQQLVELLVIDAMRALDLTV